MEVIAVVLGAGFTDAGLSEKFLDSITLLDYAFDNYSIETIQEGNSVLQEIKVSGATEETQNLTVLVKEDIQILVENGTNLNDLQPEIVLDNLKAPISAGSTVGTITYTFDGKTYSSELIAQDDVMPSKFLPILLRILLILVTLCLIFLLLKSGRSNKKEHRYSKDKSSKKKKKGGRYRYTTISNFKID